MKITPLMFGANQDKKRINSQKIEFVAPIIAQQNPISHIPRPYIPMSETQIAFRGLKFQEQVVKAVKGKKYQGEGLFTPDGKWHDFSRVGGDLLAQENLDLTKATDNEVHAYRYSDALTESLYSWTARFNKFNMDKMLATFPTLNDEDVQKQFEKNRAELWDFKKNKSLDVPVIDQKGKLSLDCVVFDTETTGLNIFGDKSRKNQPLDRIVQIGAVQVKGGNLKASSAISQLINPEMPIPDAAKNVHGISDDMVKDAPHIEQYLKGFLKKYLNKENGIIVAYNSKFDMTILNNSIRRHNNTVAAEDALKEKQPHKVLDPFILIQRIHPYLGVRKKLGEQYQHLFCAKMEGAHDALADVKGTVNVLKYCVYWLADHRKDKNVPLTLREVLMFQNGGEKIANLNVHLDSEGCNNAVNYNKSYSQVAIPVVNYFRGYHLNKTSLDEMKDEIGEVNHAKILKSGLVKKKYLLEEKEGELLVDSKDKKPDEKFKAMSYKLRSNFQKVLGFAKIEGYNGKSADEIRDYITEESKRFINQKAVNIWMKNPNPEDIKDGNDLADLKIARRVMKEAKEEAEQPTNITPIIEEAPKVTPKKLVKAPSKVVKKSSKPNPKLKLNTDTKPKPKPKKPKQ